MTDHDDRTPDEIAERFASVTPLHIARAARDAKQPTNALKFRRMGELEVRQPDWLVRGFIEADALALLIGDPGTGKSFCALDLAACIATGASWYGHRVKAGPVLYIAGEGQSGLARRCKAWERAHGLSLRDAPLFVSTVATRLTDKDAQSWLLREIESFVVQYGHPVLVVLDTLARNFGGGDENDTHDMNLAVLACDAIRRATGATVLIAHHSSHADKGRGRGSTVLRAAADAEFLLVRDGAVIKLTPTKMKDAPFPAPMSFRFDSVDLGLTDDEGEPITSAVLVPTDHEEPSKPTSAGTGKNQRRALETLRDMYERNRAHVVASGRDAGVARVMVDDWRLRCEAGGMDRRRFWEASRSLALSGLVTMENGLVTLSETSETRPKNHVSDVPAPSETSEPPYRLSLIHI